MCHAIAPARPSQARHSPRASDTLAIPGRGVSLPGRKQPRGPTGCHPQTASQQPRLRPTAFHRARRTSPWCPPSGAPPPPPSPPPPPAARSATRRSLSRRPARGSARRPGHVGPTRTPRRVKRGDSREDGVGPPVPSVLLESSLVHRREWTERPRSLWLRPACRARGSTLRGGAPRTRLSVGRPAPGVAVGVWRRPGCHSWVDARGAVNSLPCTGQSATPGNSLA